MPSMDPTRPNVLVILTDDQGCWAMGCAGNREIRTPNLDRLAATGIRFDNFFCVSPVCSPARASLLTGRIPSQHGVHDWLRAGNSTCETENQGKLIEYLAGHRAYTEDLAEAGWVCGISGKWHLGDAHHPQKGFTFWRVHAKGGGPYYDAPMVRDETDVYAEPRYVTDVITDNGLAFLDEQAGADAPFYLSVHYTAPHSPWDRNHHPPESFDPYYNDCPFESTPNVPSHPWAMDWTGGFARPERRREVLSGYYAAVTALDAGVGRLLDWLESRGLRENTLVLFTSDNGMNMGHHGIYGKGNGTTPVNMYETSVKVPALLSRPGHVPQGVVNTQLYSHYDFLPTLLEYLGLPNPQADVLPGRSFAGLLAGAGDEGRDDVVIYDEYGPVRMIRTREHKLVRRHPDGPDELYDLQADPGEETNLIDDPARADLIADLTQRLGDWFAQYVDPALDGLEKPVTGRGQLDRVHVPQEGDIPFAQS